MEKQQSVLEQFQPGYYFPERKNSATLVKMKMPQKQTDTLLPHSGSEYVSYDEINPERDEKN